MAQMTNSTRSSAEKGVLASKSSMTLLRSTTGRWQREDGHLHNYTKLQSTKNHRSYSKVVPPFRVPKKELPKGTQIKFNFPNRL